MPKAIHRTKTANLDTPGERQREGPAKEAVMMIRLPGDLKERCIRAARGGPDDDERSTANWLRHTLRKAVAAHERRVQKAAKVVDEPESN